MSKAPEKIGYFHCSHCKVRLTPPDGKDEAWLQKLSTTCPKCGQAVDWHVATLATLQHASVFFRHGAIGLLGGHILSFVIEMRPGETFELDLKQYGIDDGALILYKNYTGQGGQSVWPLEIHGNEPISSRHSKSIFLYGRPFKDADLAVPLNERTRSPINVYLAYVPQQPDTQTNMTLARAYEEFLDRDYPEMLIPASVAVEDEVKRLAAECLGREGLPNSQSRNRDLLLDLVLPLYCKANGRPWIPADIRGNIRRLWGLRDGMAHSGRLAAPLTLGHAAELLAAAILSVRFIQVFRATA
jgi:hypothetical protein